MTVLRICFVGDSITAKPRLEAMATLGPGSRGVAVVEGVERLLTSRGNVPGNWLRRGDRVVVVSSQTGLEHVAPQLRAPVASGVAAARLLAGQTLHWAWETVGVLLILAGVVTAALARRRWRAMDAAIREGEPLPAPGIAVMIAGVIVVCGVITTVLLLGTDPGHVP